MNRYRLLLARSAKKDARRLLKTDRSRVQETIRALADEPRPRGCQKIVGQSGYRIRVGVYRIVYEVDDTNKEITIYRIVHRKNAYR